jgi:hypothetical protein
MAAESQYTKTFTAFSGADIVAVIGDKVVGELQAITYSVTREKAPIYVMGDPNPKSFARGKRGIAGSMVFTVFDRDSLHALKKDAIVHRHGLNSTELLGTSQSLTAAELAEQATKEGFSRNWKTGKKVQFSDEIPPFDITINFLNEYGQAATLKLFGVEILNEGMGMSVDDITTEKACTFIARNIEEMTPQDSWE